MWDGHPTEKDSTLFESALAPQHSQLECDRACSTRAAGLVSHFPFLALIACLILLK